MKINIVIDDKLMNDALKATGLKTKKEAIELGLQLLVKRQKQQSIRSLRGEVKWDHENKRAIKAYNTFVEENGLFADEHRSF